ncbi:MAG: hypothetical protein EXX96DRAFT_570160 [Benjaminiella poitrasii]|nr:MAG: hypothetical protein EXX96DRAFT_570160 [Benjaminiella poitrasii]
MMTLHFFVILQKVPNIIRRLFCSFYTAINKMDKSNNEQLNPKAGRHRLYSNEQRKDRNRQAQAAFRTRRNNYTKSLEETVLNFKEQIAALEKTQNEAIDRALRAEERCNQLDFEVMFLRQSLQFILRENQRTQLLSPAMLLSSSVENVEHTPYVDVYPEILENYNNTPQSLSPFQDNDESCLIKKPVSSLPGFKSKGKYVRAIQRNVGS